MLKDILFLAEQLSVPCAESLPVPNLATYTEESPITICNDSILTHNLTCIPLFSNNNITQGRLDNQTINLLSAVEGVFASKSLNRNAQHLDTSIANMLENLALRRNITTKILNALELNINEDHPTRNL